MEVTRIIHPIGQGAFYTESIKTNDNLYNVVYDCGSGNQVTWTFGVIDFSKKVPCGHLG